MKNIALGTALVLSFISWSAYAEEGNSMGSMEDKCKAVGEQHGISGDKMDAWMKKCMEMSEKMNEDMNEKSDSNDMGDMKDMDDMNDHSMDKGGDK